MAPEHKVVNLLNSSLSSIDLFDLFPFLLYAEPFVLGLRIIKHGTQSADPAPLLSQERSYWRSRERTLVICDSKNNNKCVTQILLDFGLNKRTHCTFS